MFTSEITGKPNIYQTSALPMNNRGVRPEDINQLTFDRGHNMYPENEPAVEFSSRQSEISVSLPPPTQ